MPLSRAPTRGRYSRIVRVTINTWYTRFSLFMRSLPWDRTFPIVLLYAYRTTCTSTLRRIIQITMHIINLSLHYLSFFLLYVHLRHSAPARSGTVSTPGALVYPVIRLKKFEHFRQCGTPNL